MAASRIILPCMPALDRNGNPVEGALLYFYLNLTTTLQTVYADFALTTPLTNPVMANSAGVFPDIFADSAVFYSVRGFQPDGQSLPDSNFDFVQAGTSASASVAARSTNYLVNPDGTRWVLRRTAPTDTQHSFDMWRVLVSNASAITVAQALGTGTDPSMSMRLQNSQGVTLRMGQSQALETELVQSFWNGPVTLSGSVRPSVTTTIRYAILAWTGTANVPPADIVNDWTSVVFTAGNFFINTAGFSVLGTRSQTLSGGVWTDLPGLTVANIGTPNNIMVAYWTEGVIAAGATVDFRGKVEPSLLGTEFSRMLPAALRDQCDRYIQTSYDDTVAPATINATSGRLSFLIANVPANGRLPVPFRAKMHAAPTVTVYSTGATAAANNANDAAGTNYAAGATNVGQGAFEFINNSAGSQNAAAFHYVADKQF